MQPILQVQSQLAALQRKAAYRAAKRAAAAAAASPAVECDSPPHGADTMQQHRASVDEASAGEQQHADGPRQRPKTPQTRPRHVADHPATAHQHKEAAHPGLHEPVTDPAVQYRQQGWQPQTLQQPAAHLPAQPLQQPGQSQQPHKPRLQHHLQDEPQAAVPQPNAQSAAWLDALWEEAQRDVAAMDSNAGAAMPEQQDWLLLNGYESDWYSLQPFELM